MQSDLPWNISGIPTDAREAARAAARREGLSTGEWLTRRIFQSPGSDQPAIAPETGDILNRLAQQAEDEAETIAGLQQAMTALQQQIADLSAAQNNALQQEIEDLRAAQENAARRSAEDAPDTPNQVMEIGQALSEQLNSMQHFQQEFAEQNNAKIAVLAGTLAQMQKAHPAAADASADAETTGQVAQALAETDGRINALSDSFVALSGSMDLLRRDFREAMDELGNHLGSFDARLQQIEECLIPQTQPETEPAAPQPTNSEPDVPERPVPSTDPAPEPEAYAAETPDVSRDPGSLAAQAFRREPAQATKAAPAPSQHSTFTFDRELAAAKAAPNDFFSTEEAQEAAGVKDDFSPDAKLDVPWRSGEYDEDEEVEERSRRRVLIVLRIVIFFAVLLAAAAAFMAYKHIGLNELKGYLTPAPHTAVQKAAPAPQQPAHSHTADIGRLTGLAKNGNSKAMLLLGISYADGTDVPPDPAKALHWLQQAASAGEAIAQYRLGALYVRGNGTDPAPDKAAEQFALAAKAGNLQAMYLLASAYDTGTGVPRNAAEAAHWYGKAAGYGLADAALYLAQLYEQGNGVSADPVLAYQWYAIAAAEGDTDAAPHLEDLKSRLPAADLAKAGEAARAFKPDAAPTDANMVPDITKVLNKAS